MTITAKSALAAKRYMEKEAIAPPKWREIAEDMRRVLGKAELSRADIAAYLGCNRNSRQLVELLAGLPYRGQNTGKRWHIETLAKAYVRALRCD